MPVLLLSVGKKKKKRCVKAFVGDNSTDTDGDARWTPGPEGANGRRWVGGWHLHRRRNHQDKEAESAARDATLGAALFRPSMLALKYMRPYLRAHQIR